MQRWRRWLAAACVASSTILFGSAAGLGQEDDPFKAAGQADKTGGGFGKAAADSQGATEGDGELHIPIKSSSGVTFGATGCPVAVVDSQVWNLKTGGIQTTLELGEMSNLNNHLSALTDDGKYFALALESKNQQNTPVAVFSCETGEKVFTIPGDPKRFVDVLLFSLNKYVMVGGRQSDTLQVWDFAAGEKLKEIKLPEDGKHGHITFTSDGKYYAAVAKDQLGVFKTASGKPAVMLAPPRKMPRAGEVAATPVAAPVKGSKRAPKTRPVADRGDASDAVFVYAWLQSMKFSPDNQELAAISTHPEPRLICWDGKGKLTMDERLDLPRNIAFWEHSVNWLPDNSGWLVTGHVYDRATRRIVLGFSRGFADNNAMTILDKNRILGAFGEDPAELEVVEIPWTEIQASLEAMKKQEPAHLAPGQAVSVVINLEGLQGDQNETIKLITDAFTRRMQRDGVLVEPGQKTTFRVRFGEAAGDTLPIYERQSPFDFRGSDTGRKATERKGTLVMELIADGEKEPLWRDTIEASNASSFREEINDVTIRKSMLENLTWRIGELNIPYFLPKSDELFALPIVVE